MAINPEDGVRYGAPVSELDPPAVARLLRAHRNAEATIYPFLCWDWSTFLRAAGFGLPFQSFRFSFLPGSGIRLSM